MNTVLTPFQSMSLHLQPQILHLLPISLSPPHSLQFPPRPISLRVKSQPSDYDIDMVKSTEGVFTAKPQKVVVLWDLDNKPPRGPPYEAAMALKAVAQRFGDVVDISAYANRHAFIHLPHWVVEERRDTRRMDMLERKGVVLSAMPYVCSVCGRKCKTNLDLKKHFRQLHERERQKKLNRMKGLKGKKRQRFKERFIDGNEKYNEAARRLIRPKVGYGLAAELRRAGVFVKTVADKPQAADWALKRQMQHSMTRGIDWLFLVSDDSDFVEMLKRARDANLGTVVVGDFDRALGRQADLWVPWARVENGDITENDLEFMRERRMEEREQSGEQFSVSEFEGSEDGQGGLDDAIYELVGGTKFDRMRISAFSEGDEEDEDDVEDDWLRLRLDQNDDSLPRNGENEDEDRDFLSDTDDEDEVYF